MKDIHMRPLADRVIVRPIEPEQRTPSGIVLPETAKERPERGEVLAIGPGRVTERGTRLPIEVEVGDTVLFTRYSQQILRRVYRAIDITDIQLELVQVLPQFFQTFGFFLIHRNFCENR